MIEDKIALKIVAITIYTEATEFGQGFCGIAFHCADENFVLGHNLDKLNKTSHKMEPNERIVGIESNTHRDAPSLHYDLQLLIGV